MKYSINFIAGISEIKPKIAVLSLAVVFSIGIMILCYPAFMSYDSIRMLEEARSSVRGGIYPAAPVYILRLFDLTGSGPALMVFTQNFMVLLSLILLLGELGASFKKTFFIILGLLSLPTVIGCMLVLWKDVTFAALSIFSISITFWASSNRNDSFGFNFTKWMSLFFLFVSGMLRFNALTAIVFILLYWVNVFFRDSNNKKKSLLFFSILLTLIFSSKLINNHRLPSLEKLEPNHLIYAVMSYDLIGISKYSRISLLPISTSSDTTPKASIFDIDKIYSPLGAVHMSDNNSRLGYIVKLYSDKYTNLDIFYSWLKCIQKYPFSYLKYRLVLFSEIVGATSHKTFEPTHFARIDSNNMDLKFNDRAVTNMVLKYVDFTSGTAFGKPWLFFLVSLFCAYKVFKCSFLSQKVRDLSNYSFLASFFYLAPFFIISGTGEVRYCFPSIIFASVPIIVFCCGWNLTKLPFYISNILNRIWSRILTR